ncbi:hypothetical protein ZIOFF_007430 [Zingiber officinale]|uniref:Uncharacterized protein n=2 Tax=Zingiber officinale TaxID=94328 RepID=A0A8J5I1J3_ZINOF|nr:hypothetical protein ZIOFF_007430 [Zingiber officinale]
MRGRSLRSNVLISRCRDLIGLCSIKLDSSEGTPSDNLPVDPSRRGGVLGFLSRREGDGEWDEISVLVVGSIVQVSARKKIHANFVGPVSPLTEVEKILDCEMRPTMADKNDSTKVPEKEFIKAAKTHPRLKSRLNTFHKQMETLNKSDDDWVAIRPEWTTVDRVLASRNTGDEREYFVKWKELAYDECTWEVGSDISTFKPDIERYEMIQSRRPKKSRSKSKSLNPNLELKQKQKDFQQYDATPEFLSGKLHPYQLEGLNFLRFSWSKSTHVILADEMGLGKTIQSIAFLASLFEENISPYLVVAPLSTLRNWEREFATWAPHMNVVMYVGSSQAREVIRKYEFYYPKLKSKKHKKKKLMQSSNQNKQARIKFNVLLTSYEMINMDSAVLKSIEWECMIVDEGHRLKNKESKLFHSLKLYSTKHRVLLTGTPLQNNLDELFMLMHFLDAGKFASIEDFQKEFKDINQEEQIDRLHKMLAPHLLRRVKKDVMKDLPPKKELILRVELSNVQKEYYKAILTRNYQILARRGGPQISLINVVMELRKLCCHAYMLEGVEPAIEPTDANEGFRQLLDASGKMQLLDKMMVRLKEQGHRVLIYTQFQHMLDLLEDYLSYNKWTYERIDGKVSGSERQIRIDRFNAKNSTKFCFLLSTRAGGLGINLATADTVFIYDSDWNPHADLQAMARAHRLGQTNKVMIYRLITRGTIEERMMQMTKKKMILEHLVVGRLKSQNVNQGSIAISMSLHRTSFCFICTHLTSGEKEGDELRRNADVIEILRKTKFPRVRKVFNEMSPETILDHDRIIWLGDLNYRIALSYQSAKALVEMHNWRALLEKDQLRREQRCGHVFEGWKEGGISFPPTYKYSNNSDRYAGEDMHRKEKRRTPAWCDRILWYGRGLTQLAYLHGESRFSDHRPVYSVFNAEVEIINRNRIRSMGSSSRIEVEELLPYSHGFTETYY